MFILKQSDSYTWPVAFETAEDGGKHKKNKVTLEFKRLSQTEIQGLLNREGATDSEFARAVVIGWRDVFQDSNEALDFSPLMLDKLLEIPGAASAIVFAYIESANGGAKRKN